MLIDARERFAKRVAQWLDQSTLSTAEVTIRLSKFPDDFNKMVIHEIKQLRAA